MSNSKVLDREKRSLYIVPVTVSDLNMYQRHTTIYLRIHVDDEDDNAPEPVPRIVHLCEIPDTIILHTLPVDADQVGVYNCALSSASESYNVCFRNIFISKIRIF